ncbi:MAG: beta-hydroxylase [Candidatus Nealsonbacteria bacterium]|nr:beta-hydroxylase [Candidatus Nealsonbacteria bacterium]
MKKPYFADLAMRMAVGAGALPDEVRRCHAAYLAAAQRDDGGFAGRKGQSDLYYTSFALRSAAMLGTLDDATARRAAAFLEQQIDRTLPSIDFLSLIASAVLLEAAAGIDVFAGTGRDRRRSVVEFVEPLRRAGAGYAKTPRSGQASTYHTFLAIGCKQMVGAAPDEAGPAIELIRSRQRDDGGFVEIDAMRQGGTNPTAAAVGLLRMLDGLDDDVRTSAAGFLALMQTPEGGLRANGRIPIADLLSTFTGLVALLDLQAVEKIDAPAMHRFVESLSQPTGGFHAAAWDTTVDVEYTFYGLGTMALLASP